MVLTVASVSALSGYGFSKNDQNNIGVSLVTYTVRYIFFYYLVTL